MCGRLLQPGRSLRYEWDWSKGQGVAKLLTSVEVLNLQTHQWHPVVDTETYIVIANEYLADGGDKFPTFNGPEKFDLGKNDLDALIDFFEKKTNPKRHPKHQPLPIPKPRITCLNCPPLTPVEQTFCEQ